MRVNRGRMDGEQQVGAAIRRRGVLRRRRAAQFVIVVGVAATAYVIAFGESIRYSINDLFTFGSADGESVGDTEVWYLPADEAARSALQTIVIVAVAVLAMRCNTRWWVGLGSWPWSRYRVSAATICGALGMAIAALTFGALVIAAALDEWSIFSTGAGYEVEGLAVWWSAISAGVGEEIIALAVPVMVLRHYRTPTVLAIWILVALRVAYHLYYNIIGVWWLIPWAIVVSLVYWCWPDPRVLGALIAEHIAYDVVVYCGDGITPLYFYAATGVVLLVGATIAAPQWYRSPGLPTPSVSLRNVVRGYRRRGSGLPGSPGVHARPGSPGAEPSGTGFDGG